MELNGHKLEEPWPMSLRVVDNKLIARRWATETAAKWAEHYAKIPDKDNWGITVHCPDWDHLEALHDAIPEQQRRFMMMVCDGDSIEGTFTEEEKRQIIKVFGPYCSDVHKLRQMNNTGSIVDTLMRIYACKSEEDKKLETLYQRRLNGGRKYLSEVLDSIEEMKRRF